MCIINKQNQAGLSLIELMIAMLVGLILIAGVLSIFISSRASYGINSAVGQIQENGRFALEFIRTATRKAGYMGCATSADTGSYLSAAADPLAYNFNQAIYGFAYTGVPPAPTENPAPDPTAGNWTPALDAFLTGRVLPNTDVLVVRFTQNTPTYINNINNPATYMNVTGVNNLTAGELMLISNCNSAIVMQTTSPAGASTISYAAAGNPGNATTVVPSSYIGAQVVAPTTAVFYIGVGADNSPALLEANTDTTGTGGIGGNGFQTPQELVSGVESMRVLYGVDLTGSQVPSQYVTANNVANWNTVVSVRVALLLRSSIGAVPQPAAAVPMTLLESTPAFTPPLDTRLRQVFIATIGIRNSLP